MTGIQALAYHPTVAHYLRFVATTVGRDKLLRTIQYFARFYAWYLLRTNRPLAEIAPWDAVKKNFALVRKALRLGKNVEHFKAAQVAADSKTLDTVLKYCAVGRQLGYGVYLTLDAFTYLDSIGFRKLNDAKRWQAAAYRAWFVGLLFNTIAGLYTLRNLQLRTLAIDENDGESTVETKKIDKERRDAQLQLTSDVCDLALPSSALGYVNLDDGIVGLAGTVSSLIGAWGTWKKTA